MAEVPKPLDTALDLFVYAPVGLMMTAAEELPKMAAKGRSRINTQLMMARVVGQFAVTKGRQELERRFGPPGPVGATTPTPAPPATTSEPKVPVPEAHPPRTFDEMTGEEPISNGKSGPRSADEPQTAATVGSQARVGTELGTETDPAAGPPPGAAGPRPKSALAIPGYDSLSASQVVQRLAGLSQDELAAVGEYEQAHRGRRTIINRIHQLQGQ